MALLLKYAGFNFCLKACSMREAEMPNADQSAVCVSVIIPTRNRPELLRKAVASALAQDFANLEVIVVIDGEDQQTKDALSCFTDARLRIIGLAKNVGGAEARNVGVRAARGEWVAFLDDDDEWLPYKLSYQLAAARRSNAVWPVISSRMIVRNTEHEAIRPIRAYDPKQPVSEFLFCRKSLKDGPFAMQTSTLMTRRELMLAIPFRKGLKRHQDWDWVLGAEQTFGVEFAVIQEPLTIYRSEDGRDTVGRSQDWEFSMNWGGEMRRYFSAKAYSWFLASECASRAVKSRAGFRAYAEIARRFFFDGRPSLGSTITLAVFLGFPQRWRNGVHAIVRRWRRQSSTLLSLHTSDEQVVIGMES